MRPHKALRLLGSGVEPLTCDEAGRLGAVGRRRQRKRSHPREAAGTDAAARSGCALMTPALASTSRPSSSRSLLRSRSWNSAITPCARQRLIEASVIVTMADGTVRTKQRRLLTSLLDQAAHPAPVLVDLHRERWHSGKTYFSIKATMLDGRVLRSRSVQGLDQEVWPLLPPTRP
ncbi:hypothetical protein [Streptomyces sp. NPDC002889]|uniref:hypothetical protein n=1 Tax=Streptomyces sp. NPDC002889 TaxID=3364669 RepID=UPI0036BCAB49